MSFLATSENRSLSGRFPTGFQPLGLYLGHGGQALEVAVFESDRTPSKTTLKDALKTRRAGRASPILVVVLHGDRMASICGLDEEEPTFLLSLDRDQVERLCRRSLDAPNRHVGSRTLREAFPQLETKLPGVINHGLFAMHELETGV